MANPKAKTYQQKLGFFDEDLKKPQHDDIMKWLNRNIEAIIINKYGLGSWPTEYVEKRRKEFTAAIEDAKSRDERELFSLKNKLEVEGKRYHQGSTGDTYKKITEKEAAIARLKNFTELGAPPQRKPPKFQITWEHPVKHAQYKGFGIVGYIDMKVAVSWGELFLHGISTWRDSGVEMSSCYGDVYWKEINDEEKLVLLFEVKTAIPSLGELFRQMNTYKEYQTGTYVIVCPDDSEKDLIQKQGFSFMKYTGEEIKLQ